MECDSVLGQQSISGKNVSLILCVWKPCYVKSGHIWWIDCLLEKCYYLAYALPEVYETNFLSVVILLATL